MYDYHFGIRRVGNGVNKQGIRIGYDSTLRPFFLNTMFLEGHMLILGKTGTGKSTLLLNLISQLLNRGNNVVLIDPHGDISERALCMDSEVNKIYLGSGTVDGSRYQTCMNFLSTGGENTLVERTSEWIRSIFSHEQEISSGTWGPRLQLVYSSMLKEYMLQNSNNSTLSGFLDLLTNRDRMKEFLEKSSDRSLANFIDQQMKNSLRWSDYIASSVNKLLSILSNDDIRSVISSPNESINLRNIVAKSGNLIVSGITKKNNSEEATGIFSLLLLMKIWNELTSLSSNSVYSKTYIIIDESQDIPDSILKTLLSEGRKFGVSLVLSTQFLRLKNRDITDFIMGNVRNFAVFQISPQESAFLSAFFSGKIKERADTLFRENTYHNFLFWSTGETMPLIPISLKVKPLHVSTENVTRIIYDSLRKYGMPHVKPECSGVIRPHAGIHNIIIRRFRDKLQKNGLEMDMEKRRRDFISDGYFVYHGREHLVEVEVSDMNVKGRVISKILNLSGERLVIVVNADETEKLVNFLKSPSRILCDGRVTNDLGIIVNGVRRYSSDVWSAFPDIVPVIYDGKEFKIPGGRGLVTFSPARMIKIDFPVMRLRGSSHISEKIGIYKKMMQTRRYIVKFSDEMLQEIPMKMLLSMSRRPDCEVFTAGDLI